jgi:hypothetical protein
MEATNAAIERELSKADHRAIWWIGAVCLAGVGLTELVEGASQLFHSHPLSFDIVASPLVCLAALAWSVKFRRYVRDTSRLGFMTEPVANNCQYLIATQQMIAILAMFFFHPLH